MESENMQTFAKQKGRSGNGAKIKGPGTPTSDSIDGEVVETGEPIRVSTGERIVSAKQNDYLGEVASQMGHEDVDSMLEAGTGRPVGPTVKVVPVRNPAGPAGGGKIKAAAKDHGKRGKRGSYEGGGLIRKAAGAVSGMFSSGAEKQANAAVAGMKPAPATPTATGVGGGLDGSGGNSVDTRMAKAGLEGGGLIKRASSALSNAFQSDTEKRANAAVTGMGAPPPAKGGVGAGLDGSGGNSVDTRMAKAGLANGGAIRNAARRGYEGGGEPEPTKLDRLFVPQESWQSSAAKRANAGAAETVRTEGLAAQEKAAFQNRQAVSQITAPASASNAPAAQAQPAAAQAQPVQQAYADEATRAPAVNAPVPAPTPAPAGALPGITRIDQGNGKSPLFTNLAADDPSNVALMKRGPVTTENQAAMDGIQERQDAADARRLQAAADGQANSQAAIDSSNLQQLAARAVLEKQGVGRKERAAISNRTAEMERTLLANQIARRGQDQQAGALRESQKLAQNRFGLDQNADARAGATFAQQQQQRAKVEGMLAAHAAETDPAKRAALVENIRAMSPGGGGHAKDNFITVGGGQEWDSQAGVMRNVPARLIDVRTGQEVGGGKQAAAPLPPKDKLVKGQTYQTPRGPAVWDGAAFN